MSMTPHDSKLLTRVFERLTWVNDGIIEAYELGNVPGQALEPWTADAVRSIVNVYRLTLPAGVITSWARNGEAASQLMQRHRDVVSHENRMLWDRVAQFLHEFASAVRDLPETEVWADDPSLDLLDPGPGSVVVRFDLLANLLDPTGVAAMQEAFRTCASCCHENCLAVSPPHAFVTAAHDRVASLGAPIDVPSFAASLQLFQSFTRLLQDFAATFHGDRDMSVSGFRVLFALWVAGDAELDQIVALSGVKRVTAEPLVTSLIQAGFVEHTPLPDAGGAVVVRLTEQGNTMVEDGYREQNAREAEMFSALEPHELNELGRLLRKVNVNRA